MDTPYSATAALDRCFLETRGKILEIAANLDRIDRGEGKAEDPRLAQIHKAIAVLLEPAASRAERCQLVFSLQYDDNWQSPNSGG